MHGLDSEGLYDGVGRWGITVQYYGGTRRPMQSRLFAGSLSEVRNLSLVSLSLVRHLSLVSLSQVRNLSPAHCHR